MSLWTYLFGEKIEAPVFEEVSKGFQAEIVVRPEKHNNGIIVVQNSAVVERAEAEHIKAQWENELALLGHPSPADPDARVCIISWLEDFTHIRTYSREDSDKGIAVGIREVFKTVQVNA